MANVINFDVKDIITTASKDAKIKLLPGVKIGKKAAAGVGVSKLRPSGDTSGATITCVATILDKILVENAIAAKMLLDGIYGEVTLEGHTYCFTCGEDGINYKDKPLTGANALIPLVCYYLSEPDPYKVDSSELCSIFAKIRDNYARTGAATVNDVALFCDSFYYTAMSHIGEDGIFEVKEDHPAIGQIANALRNYDKAKYEETVKPIPMFSGVDMPALTGLPNYMELEKETDASDYTVENIKAGKFRLNYDFGPNKEVKSLSYLDNVVISDIAREIIAVAHKSLSEALMKYDAGFADAEDLKETALNIMLVGRPGTGKTTVANIVSAALGLPTFSTIISHNTEEDSFTEKFVPNERGVQAVKTGYADIHENGGVAILEEVNLAGPGVTAGALGQALEYPFVLELSDHQVKRHPLCMVIGAMNVNTFGSKGLNQAFDSRFLMTFVLDDPERDVFIDILRVQTKCSQELAEWVYDAYTRILNTLNSKEYNSEDLCLNITLRACVGAIRCIKSGIAPKRALEHAFYGKVYVNDPSIADRIKEEVIDSLRDFRGNIC